MLKYKWICIAVLCCALFVACEPASDTPTAQTPITFSNGIVRAAQVKVPDDNARMWAYYTDDNSDVNWVYGNADTAELATLSDIDPEARTAKLTINGNTKYWFDGTYNFFSIYSEDFINGNHSGATLDTENNQLTFDYDISNQNELRYACDLNTTGTTDRTTEVILNYQHLLSRIKFRGSSSVDGMPIKMTKFIVTATKTAEYAIATEVTCSTATATETIQLLYADGVNTVTNDTGFKYKDATEVLKDVEGNTIKSLKYTELPYAATLEAGKILEQIENSIETDEDYAWLVFPTNANEISITVEYVDNQGIITQKTATLPSSPLEMGKSYIFQFSIQPSGPITFGTFTVRDWIDDSNNREEIDLS